MTAVIAAPAERHSVREALRSDLPAAHMGLGVTVIVLIVVASFSDPDGP
ncbi:hypothetical protein OG730_00740 [Streptomyces sp. NBC_01298]|nr:hypothetical protein OG730_00740 [Streptomyces sp. NBC_01298]